MKNVKIGTKVIAVVALLAIITGMIILLSENRMASMSSDYNALVNGPAVEGVYLARANRFLSNIKLDLYAIIAETSPDETTAMSKQIATDIDKFHGFLDKAEGAVPADTQQLEAVRVDLGKMRDPIRQLVALGDAHENDKALDLFHKEIRAPLMALQRKVADIVDRAVAIAAADAADAAASATRTIYVSLGVAIIGLLIGVITALVIAKVGIVKPIAGVNVAMQKVGDGDLGAEIPGMDRADEVGMMARTLAAFCDKLQAGERQRAAHQLEQERLHNDLLRQERLATLGQLAGTVSHELRNPLGTIRSCLYLLERRLAGADDKTREVMDRANRGIARCVAIIEDFLDYARVHELKLETVCLDQWLAELLPELELAPTIQVTLVADQNCVVNVDRERFHQVMVNLVANAKDAINGRPAHETPGEISIQCRHSGDDIVVCVTDNGEGIKAEHIPRIFEPLFTTKSFGVGLGLPLIKRLIEQHAGTVEVQSQEGGPTRFVITLPRAQCTLERAGLNLSSDAASAAESTSCAF